VEIPSVFNNANVNPSNYNTIKNNGNYNVPDGYTGWNSFKVDVEDSTTTVDDNEVNITLPAEPNFDPYGDPYTLNISNFDDENNPLISWNQFDEKYATSINLDLGEFVEQLYKELKLENGQVILENGEYQIYDYEKDNDLDIQKRTLKLSRDVIDDPGYRNIGSFRVSVPTSGGGSSNPIRLQNKMVSVYQNGQTKIRPDISYNGLSQVTVNTNVAAPPAPPIHLQNKMVSVYKNGQKIINPDSSYDGLGQVTVNTNVPAPPIKLQNKTINITQNGNYTFNADNGYDGLRTVNINTDVESGDSGGNVWLQDKTVEISNNGQTIVETDPGYTGMAKVYVNTNVPTTINLERKTVTTKYNGITNYRPSPGYNGIEELTVVTDVDIGGHGSSLVNKIGIKYNSQNVTLINLNGYSYTNAFSNNYPDSESNIKIDLPSNKSLLYWYLDTHNPFPAGYVDAGYEIKICIANSDYSTKIKFTSNNGRKVCYKLIDKVEQFKFYILDDNELLGCGHWSSFVNFTVDIDDDDSAWLISLGDSDDEYSYSSNCIDIVGLVE